MAGKSSRLVDIGCAILATLAIAAALWHLIEARSGLTVERLAIGSTPATIYRPAKAAPAPVVVIAHGFAGSQQLMQAFAVTFARNGVIAVTFDFLGHGRNPHPLAGSIVEIGGATRNLVAETAAMIESARRLGDGRVALLGHSMASDIVIRAAQAAPDIAATIAVSAFSPVVTKDSPRNLLLISGGWEGRLREQALKLAGQVSAPEPAKEGVTYEAAPGNARRAAVAESTEHVSVLFSRASMAEAQGWIDRAFALQRSQPPYLDAQGGWIVLLLAGIILLVRPLSGLLPVVAEPRAGASLGWRRLWPCLLVSAIATPLILRVAPTHFLPVLVGDYLAAHFALYGLLTWLMLLRLRSGRASRTPVPLGRLLWTAALATTLCLGGLGLAIDSFVTSFAPGLARLPLIAALLVGTLSYFLAAEWLTRGEGAARGTAIAAQLAFLVSLVLAIALDFERLFFLAIIVPVIMPFLLVFGLFSRWLYRRTGHPAVGAIANAVAFAWAIGVTFPLLSG
jgi:dienelactone hydrolase